MLKIVYAEQGGGKSKVVVKNANDLVETAKGSIVFIDDDKSRSYDIDNKIRLIDASEYKIDGPKMFFGFLCGVSAQDFDLEAIFVDGFSRIVKHDPADLEEFFSSIDDFGKKNNIEITISVNGDPKEMPKFLEKYFVEFA